MMPLLLTWLALLVALVLIVGKPGKPGALTLAYFLGLSLIHAPGALALLGREGGVLFTASFVGFKLTILGLAALVAGVATARVWRKRAAPAPTAPALGLGQFGWRAIALGAVAYFLLLPVVRSVPSLTSVVAGSATLLVLGLWIRLYDGAARHDTKQVVVTLLLLPLLPLATLITGGFIGYGTYWALSVVAFFYVISRRRLLFYLLAPLAVVLGLSLFISYMGQRTGIRDVVWQQRASVGARIERTSRIVTEFKLMKLDDPNHSAALVDRLNQNLLVGVGVLRAQDHQVGFAHGETIGLWALIPRALWPSKPVVSGGSILISKFTGLSFGPGTTVGIGQVLEFYMNFGVPGVVVGFFLLGLLLMRLDQGFMRAVATRDMKGVLMHAMPGLALMQPGGNLREIMVAVAASLAAAQVVMWLKLLPSAGAPDRPALRPTQAAGAINR